MKRLLLALGAVGAFFALAIPSAFAADPSVTLSVVPTPWSPGQTVTINLAQTVTPNPGSFSVWGFTTPDCTEPTEGTFRELGGPFMTGYLTGTASVQVTIPTDFNVQSIHVAFLAGEYFSNCVSIAGPSAFGPPPVGIFLCYSTYQTEPGVWPKDVALALLTQGYWLPYAVPGDVSGGTNIGGFHLVCNLAASQSVSDQFVGGDGTVLGPLYSGVPGVYPKVGG